MSVVCLVVTQQEGYLYQFMMQALQEPISTCLTVYPFTAPVIAVAMGTFVLHALTETGLETYTLRTGHHLVAALDAADNMASVSTACQLFIVQNGGTELTGFVVRVLLVLSALLHCCSCLVDRRAITFQRNTCSRSPG
jgi:hypothetical protein